MAFSITLQTCTSEKNKVQKTLTDIATLSGTLRAETSIIDPVITIEGDLALYTGCNYLTIPSFGRSYFVQNIRSIRNGLFEISAHVDVLSSYGDQLMEQQAIIRRQENDWNLYLNDGVFKVYQDPIVLTMPFPSGFSGPEFVLAIAGHGPTTTAGT